MSKYSILKVILDIVNFILCLLMIFCSLGGGSLFYLGIAMILGVSFAPFEAEFMILFTTIVGYIIGWLLIRPIYLLYFGMGDGILYDRLEVMDDANGQRKSTS